MHRRIRNHDKCPRDHRQSDNVRPQRLRVESKRTQNRRSRNLNIQPVLVINQRQVGYFVYDQGLESIMEDRQLSHND